MVCGRCRTAGGVLPMAHCRICRCTLAVDGSASDQHGASVKVVILWGTARLLINFNQSIARTNWYASRTAVATDENRLVLEGLTETRFQTHSKTYVVRLRVHWVMSSACVRSAWYVGMTEDGAAIGPDRTMSHENHASPDMSLLARLICY